MRAETLDSIARDVLKKLDPFYLSRQPQTVPIEYIIEKIFRLSIEYMRLTVGHHELGRMIYDNGYSTRFNADKDDYELVRVSAGTMLIESLLLEVPSMYGRFRFTLAHELSHWILHKSFFTGTNIAAAFSMDQMSDETMEWQANYLAKSILMPTGQVKRGFYNLQGDLENKVSSFAQTFEVSKQAMRIRLQEVGLIAE